MFPKPGRGVSPTCSNTRPPQEGGFRQRVPKPRRRVSSTCTTTVGCGRRFRHRAPKPRWRQSGGYACVIQNAEALHGSGEGNRAPLRRLPRGTCERQPRRRQAERWSATKLDDTEEKGRHESAWRRQGEAIRREGASREPEPHGGGERRSRERGRRFGAGAGPGFPPRSAAAGAARRQAGHAGRGPVDPQPTAGTRLGTSRLARGSNATPRTASRRAAAGDGPAGSAAPATWRRTTHGTGRAGKRRRQRSSAGIVAVAGPGDSAARSEPRRHEARERGGRAVATRQPRRGPPRRGEAS